MAIESGGHTIWCFAHVGFDQVVKRLLRVGNAILLAISYCCMGACVLDTDVLVAAFRSDAGASRQVLEAARAHRFELLLCVPLMLEYESVLTRPEHLAACRASRVDVSAVLDELALVGKRVKLMIRTADATRSNDEMVRKRPSMDAPMPSSLSTSGILDLWQHVFDARAQPGKSFED